MLDRVVAAAALVDLVGRDDGNGCPRASEAPDAADALHVALGIAQVEIDHHRGLGGREGGWGGGGAGTGRLAPPPGGGGGGGGGGGVGGKEGREESTSVEEEA
jgi:hypothetical protein